MKTTQSHSTTILQAISFLTILTSLKALTYPSFNGYQVRELATTNLTRFKFEATPWVVVGFTGTDKVSQCNYPILGGYGILLANGYFERTYTGLPAHNAVYFHMRFSLIDSWKNSDSIQILFDSKPILISQISSASTQYATDVCGGPDDDVVQAAIVGTFAHQDDILVFQVVSLATELPTEASFGIRGISIIFVNTTEAVSDDNCYYLHENSAPTNSANGQCKCGRGSYFADTNQCLDCNSSCAACFGPLASQCYVCAAGYSFVGTECIQCHSSCNTCSGLNKDQCVTCKSKRRLQWKKTGTATGNFPASSQEVVADFKVCNNPCGSPQFILYDYTCVDSCLSPLVQKTIGNYQTCNKPCLDGEYYYTWNNTCGSQCTSPFMHNTESNVDTCKLPCDANEYLYPNNSCLPTCPYPLLNTTIDFISICQYPCNFTAGEFFGWDGSCLQTCDTPYIQRIENDLMFCDQPIPIASSPDNSTLASASNSTANSSANSTEDSTTNTTENKEVAKVLTTIQTTGAITSAGIVAFSIASSTSPSAISLTSLVKMLQYIRYISINYPPKLKNLLRNQNSSSISLNFAPDLPQSILDQFPDHPLPANFEDFDLSSSFFVNYNDTVCTLGIILVIIILSSIMANLTRNHKKINTIFTKIKNVTRWDFFLLILCSNYDGIAFFSSLELRKISLDSLAGIFSIFMCAVVNIVAIFVLFKLLSIVISIRKSKYKTVFPLGQNGSVINTKKEWETCKLLFKSFKDESFSQQAFMFFFLIRLYLFDVVIGVLYRYPLVQASILVAMSTAMVLYLIIKRPCREVSNFIEYLVNESILLVVNANVLAMAVFDTREESTTVDTRIISGDLIIYANIVFNVLALVFMTLEVVIGVIKAYKIIKNSKGRTIWIKLILIFFERDAMEVEDKGQEEHEDAKPNLHQPPKRDRYKVRSSLNFRLNMLPSSSDTGTIDTQNKETLQGGTFPERTDSQILSEILSPTTPNWVRRESRSRIVYPSHVIFKDEKTEPNSPSDVSKSNNKSLLSRFRVDTNGSESPMLIESQCLLNVPASPYIRRSLPLKRPSRLRGVSYENQIGDTEIESPSLEISLKSVIGKQFSKDGQNDDSRESIRFGHDNEGKTIIPRPRKSLMDTFMRKDPGRSSIQVKNNIPELNEENL